MIVVPFEIAHFHQLRLQPSQEWLGSAINTSTIEQMATGQSYTIFAGEKVAAIAGLMEHHKARAHAWALIDRAMGAQFTTLHRIVHRFVALAPYPRVETTVEIGFTAGHRWAKSLGFVVEAERMVAYDQAGNDHTLYRWVH